MNEDRIKELFSNEEFVKDLFASESYEVAQKKLADKDVNISVEELKKTYELFQKKQTGEISDEDLEDVAGGGLVLAAIITASIATAGLIGFAGYCEAKKSKKCS